MRPSQRRKALAELDDLVGLLAADHARALDRLDEWSGGFPTGGTGTNPSAPVDDEGIAIDYSDRTGDAATSTDRFRRDIARFDLLLDDARKGLRRAHRIVQAALVAGQAITAGPGCRSCARDTDHQGRPYAVAAWRTDLCRWCADWQGSHGAWPPVAVLKAHHAGTVITPKVEERLTRVGR